MVHESQHGEKIWLVGKLRLTQWKWTSFLRLENGVSGHRDLEGRQQLNHHLWSGLTQGQSAAGLCVALWSFELWVFLPYAASSEVSGAILPLHLCREKLRSLQIVGPHRSRRDCHSNNQVTRTPSPRSFPLCKRLTAERLPQHPSRSGSFISQ